MPEGPRAALGTRRRQAYDVHGVGVVVEADDPRVIAAVQMRLRGFPELTGRPVDLRVTYTGSAPEGRPGPRRPVYDTPDGRFDYLPVSDRLIGRLGDVTLDCDLGAGRATLHSPSFSGRALYLATHPILTVCLIELFKRHGLYSLHAACLAAPASEQALLLTGPSGSGKSTLALALARAGLPFLSDDFVFLTGTEPVRALGFADAIGITAATAQMLRGRGVHAPLAALAGFPKRLGRIEDILGHAARPQAVPAVIVFPRVRAHEPSALTELDPGSALLRLVPDVLLTQARVTEAHLATIGSLLEQCRCYELVSGIDLDRAAELTAALV